MSECRRDGEAERVKVEEPAREQEEEDGRKWLRVCIAPPPPPPPSPPLLVHLLLKEIEATNAAVRLLFRSLKKKKAALKG